MIGKTALQGEISRKADHPIQIDDQVILAAALGAPSQLGTFTNPLGVGIIQGWETKKMLLSIKLQPLRYLVKQFGADNLTAVAELEQQKIHNLEDKSVLRYEAPGTAYGKGFGDSFLGVTGLLLQQIILIIGMRFLCIPQSHLTMM